MQAVNQRNLREENETLRTLIALTSDGKGSAATSILIYAFNYQDHMNRLNRLEHHAQRSGDARRTARASELHRQMSWYWKHWQEPPCTSSASAQVYIAHLRRSLCDAFAEAVREVNESVGLVTKK